MVSTTRRFSTLVRGGKSCPRASVLHDEVCLPWHQVAEISAAPRRAADHGAFGKYRSLPNAAMCILGTLGLFAVVIRSTSSGARTPVVKHRAARVISIWELASVLAALSATGQGTT